MRLINKHAFCGFYQSIKEGGVKYSTLFHFPFTKKNKYNIEKLYALFWFVFKQVIKPFYTSTDPTNWCRVMWCKCFGVP